MKLVLSLAQGKQFALEAKPPTNNVSAVWGSKRGRALEEAMQSRVRCWPRSYTDPDITPTF